MKTAVVEDEQYFVQAVCRILSACGISAPDIYRSPALMKKSLKSYDLVISDVCFQSTDPAYISYETTSKIKTLIYISSFGDHARFAYSPAAVAFVLKENLEKELPEALKKACKVLFSGKRMNVKTVSGEYALESDRILYAGIEDGVLTLHCLNRSALILSERSLKTLGKSAGFEDFAMLNQSCLVRLGAISAVNPGSMTVILKDGSLHKGSRRKWKEFFRRYQEFL